MTIVAVNGGGNTPQGVQLEPCFVKSWSTSGDADDRPTEDFQPEFTSEPTTAPDVAIYNGFEVVNTTSLSYGDGGFIILG